MTTFTALLIWASLPIIALIVSTRIIARKAALAGKPEQSQH